MHQKAFFLLFFLQQMLARIIWRCSIWRWNFTTLMSNVGLSCLVLNRFFERERFLSHRYHKWFTKAMEMLTTRHRNTLKCKKCCNSARNQSWEPWQSPKMYKKWWTAIWRDSNQPLNCCLRPSAQSIQVRLARRGKEKHSCGRCFYQPYQKHNCPRSLHSPKNYRTRVDGDSSESNAEHDNSGRFRQTSEQIKSGTEGGGACVCRCVYGLIWNALCWQRRCVWGFWCSGHHRVKCVQVYRVLNMHTPYPNELTPIVAAGTMASLQSTVGMVADLKKKIKAYAKFKEIPKNKLRSLELRTPWVALIDQF